jgi:hypothetical protein
MVEGMTDKLKVVLLAKGRHLGRYQGLATGTAQPGQIGIVNNALPGDISPIGQRLMEKALHTEAVKVGIELEVTAYGVAQVKQTGWLYACPLRSCNCRTV